MLFTFKEFTQAATNKKATAPKRHSSMEVVSIK